VKHRNIHCASTFISIFAADAFVSLAISSLPAAAQVPGSINPGLQLQEQFNPGVQLQEQIRESAPPPRDYEAPLDNESGVDKINAPSDDLRTEESFFFKAVRIEGNSEFSDEILIQPFLPLIGKEVTFNQLKKAASQSELNYKKTGFITSRVLIPSQDINSGNIVIKVVEGFIENIDVRGSADGTQEYIRKMLQPVVNNGPKKNL
jgi:hemolysin activation/secretion protein